MGNFNSKKRIYNNPMKIQTDENGIILDVDLNFTLITGYKSDIIKGEFVGLLMNDLISYLHKKIFFPKIKAANKIEKVRILRRLSDRTKERPMILYTVSKAPIYCTFEIEPYNDGYKMSFLVSDTQGNIFTYQNMHRPESFLYSKTDVIVCCLDFVDSTKMLKEKGDFYMANLSLEFYNRVRNIIKESYYPYVYIHEIVGDSFVLILNAEWTYKIPDYCCTIFMNFITELIDKTSDLVQFRVGVSFGKILYGYIGNQLRLFGDTINLASRLEHISKTNHIYCCQNFMIKFQAELSAHSSSKITFEENEVDLKGFEKQKAYLLSVSQYNTHRRRSSISHI